LTVSSNKKIENKIRNLELLCAEDYEETDTFEGINFNNELMYVDDVILIFNILQVLLLESFTNK